MLPYLHERKIFLNRIKLNTEYFYTLVETKVEDSYQYMKSFNIKSNDLAPPLQSLESPIKSFSSVIAMNVTEYKYYVYTQNGILANRVAFQDYVN